MDQFKKAGIDLPKGVSYYSREAKEDKPKFEPKQAPKDPDLTKVVGAINDFYSSNGYAPLLHDKKLELARKVYAASMESK